MDDKPAQMSFAKEDRLCLQALNGHPPTAIKEESKGATAEGQDVASSSSSSKKRRHSMSTEEMDMAYREKRRKNNESAKRSRDAKREKEELLEREHFRLQQSNAKKRAYLYFLDVIARNLEQRLKSSP